MVIARRSRAAVVLSVLVSGVVLSSSAVSLAPRSADRRSPRRNGHHGHGTGPEADPRGKRATPNAGTRPANCAPSRTQRGSSSHPSTRSSRRIQPRSKTEARSPRSPRLRRRDPAWVQDEAAAGEAAALAAPTWTFVKNHCFSQISDTWSVLDHCYYKYKLANDGSSSYDWYALQRYGTAHRNSPWVLDLARIRAYRSGGSSQSWADWNPRVDWYGGNCSTTSIGISTPVGGISKSFERCPDQVTFKKSANGTQPDYTQTGSGSDTRQPRVELRDRCASHPGRHRFLRDAGRCPGKPVLGMPTPGRILLTAMAVLLAACSVGAPPAGTIPRVEEAHGSLIKS